MKLIDKAWKAWCELPIAYDTDKVNMIEQVIVKQLRECADCENDRAADDDESGRLDSMRIHAAKEEAYRNAIKIIESLSAKLQAANMEQSATDCDSEWISCGDGKNMPDIMKPVLVCDKQGNVCVRAITSEIEGRKYWSQDKYDVIAWQPLPEPYKKITARK